MEPNNDRVKIIYNGQLLELDESAAEQQFGIARGLQKEVDVNELSSTDEQVRFLFLRSHQSLIVKSDHFTFGDIYANGVGPIIIGNAVGDGTEAHFKPYLFVWKGTQGSGIVSADLIDAQGNKRKLHFGYVITQN